MKFTAICLAATLAVAAAHEEAHVRVHVAAGEKNCQWTGCKTSGEWCDLKINQCRPPKGRECYNPATGFFDRHGCARGFKCVNGRCEFARKKKHHHKSHDEIQIDETDCQWTGCETDGQWCDLDINQCRFAEEDECYNPATGLFDEACAPGFECVNGRCEFATDDKKKKIKSHAHHGKHHINEGNCQWTGCKTKGQWCDLKLNHGKGKCRFPKTKKECYDPSQGFFLPHGCTHGFVCRNNRCEFA